MIYSDNQIFAKGIEVRFYKTDPNDGRGDYGTATYMSIPLSGFLEIKNTRFNGEVYYKYHFTSEMHNRLCGIFGSKYFFVDHDYEMASETKRLEEIAEAERILKVTKYMYI